MVRYYNIMWPLPCTLQKHRFKSFPVLHFYDLKVVQESEMRRQMTDPPFLFWGNENLIPKRMGKNCSALKKAFHMLLPAPMAEPFMHCLPNMEHFWEGTGSTAATSLPSHTGSPVCWQGRKEPQQLPKWERGRPQWHPLADKASWLHPFDRPSFSAYHAKSKYPSVSWRTCSISDLIVLNIASSLQINGNIKSRSNGIPQSLWSS